MKIQSICKVIDHTLLKPEASKEDIENLCKEALKFEFASVCINPCNVKLAYEYLKDTNVKVCTVIGFPLGANKSEVKSFEAIEAVKDGAKEIDMVINIGSLKKGDYDYVKKDIKSVVHAVKGKALVKVIIENCLLEENEKIKACLLAKEAGADFVKTSTGFSKYGATVEDVKIMRKTVGEEMGVKAAGGIHTYEEALAMIKAGASRIGASASIDICNGAKQ
ncbi:deoxyribose-phosphate aldolase [Clostridium acetireducens DSM 10703]|uniref:Deoxyribose-phosphate aldolase n=1 Tax=Clostridium acetireducens DSM 10703 TaxID=1121290 RepID=A0A1E8F1K7_9CLOT|nr:deoxyribose-phosphate aldolase [Clostridium acetireducens]OFI07533.1 deoxyribose-phosphate aldolase [Clostridium acetireducens DSM 10703]